VQGVGPANLQFAILSFTVDCGFHVGRHVCSRKRFGAALADRQLERDEVNPADNEAAVLAAEYDFASLSFQRAAGAVRRAGLGIQRQ